MLPVTNHLLLFALLTMLWTLPWKAWALWLAARRNERWWFLALLVLNTFAVLEIIYIFFIAKQKDERVTLDSEQRDGKEDTTEDAADHGVS